MTHHAPLHSILVASLLCLIAAGGVPARGQEAAEPEAAPSEATPTGATPADTTPAEGPAAPGPRSEAVTYANGELQLAAELLLPAIAGERVPGAVILQGSGDSDRTNGWARAIAEALRDRGLAVLLTDKRGSGLSDGDWRQVGFGELAGDAIAGLRWLAARPEVDARRVGLVGLSQGGRVAPIAASAYSAAVAFVINVSGSAVSFAEQSFFEMANTTRRAGHDEETVAEVLELNRLAARYLLRSDWDTYAAARAAGLESPWAEIAEGFPAAKDDPIWGFLRRVLDFDPLPYWVLVRQPVLAIYGADDEADNVPVAESSRRLRFAFEAAGRQQATVVIVEGAGHGLRDPGTGDLHPELLASLDRWLARHVLTAAE